MNNATTCRVAECERPIKYKTQSLCNAHYLQWHRGKPFTKPRQRGGNIGDTPCEFSGCDRTQVARGWCHTHYKQWSEGRKMEPHGTYQRRRGSAAERDSQGRKECQRCREWKPECRFYADARSIDGFATVCRDCRKEESQRRAPAARMRAIERHYNITASRYAEMLEEQGGACALCGTTSPGSRDWHVDHDHACCPEAGRSCGKCVRALLCGRCNTRLGYIEDADWFGKAQAYLSR